MITESDKESANGWVKNELTQNYNNDSTTDEDNNNWETKDYLIMSIRIQNQSSKTKWERGTLTQKAIRLGCAEFGRILTSVEKQNDSIIYQDKNIQ